jgi:MFS family permease
VSASTAFVPDPSWFMVNRFLLGFSEAGFHAFLIYYINQIFPGSIRGFAIGLTFISIPLSMIVASPLSGLLLNMEIGHIKGWQSLFIIEGVPSIILGLLCLKLIPDTPSHIGFLNNEERAWLEQELEKDIKPTKESGSIRGVKDSLLNPLAWQLSYVLFSMLVAVNVMTVWMPQMIRQVSGAGNVQVGILNSFPWLAFGLGTFFISRLSDKMNNRVIPFLASIATATVGFIIAAVFQYIHPQIGFCGFLLASFCSGAAQGLFWILTMELITGPSAATSYAVITVIGNGSGVIIHPMIGRIHDTTGSFAGVVWALVVFYGMALGTIYLIKQHNTDKMKMA